MKRLLFVCVLAVSFLSVCGFVQLTNDPMRPYRHYFQAGGDFGEEPPLPEHRECYWLDDNHPSSDWIRIRAQLLRDPRFAAWAKSGDLTRVPPATLSGTGGCSISLDNARTHEHIDLLLGGFDAPLELEYVRPLDFHDEAYRWVTFDF